MYWNLKQIAVRWCILNYSVRCQEKYIATLFVLYRCNCQNCLTVSARFIHAYMQCLNKLTTAYKPSMAQSIKSPLIFSLDQNARMGLPLVHFKDCKASLIFWYLNMMMCILINLCKQSFLSLYFSIWGPAGIQEFYLCPFKSLLEKNWCWW